MNEISPERVKEVFNQAVSLPPEERAAFLDETCGLDTPLRRRVARLLKSLDEVGPFLASPTGDVAAGVPTVSASTAAPLAEIGTSIGPYKLLQEIGEGGFGVVYMAEQERPVHRRVALKIIKLGMDTKQVIARFEAEREALAMMEHPNIARALDAGATETGRPYFVMELVKGVPITDYCDSNRLSTRERLDLFMQLCSAVQHAHQKGIIHRDIKASNVMVTLHDGKPVPKVIDFGISKATHQRLTEKTLFTQYGQFIGTPVYMSPEQAEMSGLDVDTRSDIYSLGVLLYELLTGTTPFDVETLRQAGYGEIQRIIREEEPPTPSTRLSTLGGALTNVAKHRGTDSGGLTRLVRGDLDWIVMKALEKDRTRRYTSASAFSEDITRHLTNEPVVARPQSAGYKLKKFVRRNRGPVAAAAAIGATIIVLGSVAAWQAHVAWQRANRLWVNSVVASGEASEDPLLKAQLALELAHLPEHPGRLSLAREAADHPLPLAVFRGHRGAVMSEDGRRILSVKQDGTARLLSTDGSVEPTALPGQWKKLQEGVFSPDGTRLLTTSGDGTVRLLRMDDTEKSIVLREEGDIIDRAKFSPDGSHFFTGSRGGVLRLWRTDATESSIIVGEHEESVMSAAFSPDGTRLLACYRDAPPRIWRADGSGEHVVLPHGARSPDLSHRVHGGTFSPDGSLVLTGSFDGMARVWRADGSGAPIVLRHEGMLFAAEFSPDGTQIVTATEDGTAWIWPADGSAEPIALRGHTDWPSTATFSPDGTRVLTASKDGTARLWRVDDPGRSVILASSLAWIWGAAFTPDGIRVITVTQDEIRIWRADDKGEGTVFGTEVYAGASLSVDGTQVLVKSADGTLRIWRVDGTGEPTVVGSLHGPGGASFSPDGTRIVGCAPKTAGGVATIWHIDGSEEPIVLQGQHRECRARFTPDGSRIVTTGSEGTVKVWPADGAGEPVVLARDETRPPGFPFAGFTPDGKKVIILTREDEVQLASFDGAREPTTLVRHEGLSGAAFNSDGTRLATCSKSDNTARVWRADGSGSPVVLPHDEGVHGVRFSPDGTRIITATEDGTLRIWHADGSGEPITLRGHTAHVIDGSFSPDGTLMATASMDGTARVWRADGTGEPLVLRGHGAMIESAEFTPDGTRLLTAGSGSPRLRLVAWPALLKYLRENTHLCLTAEERVQYLVETPAEAQAAYVKCERRQGRSGAIM